MGVQSKKDKATVLVEESKLASASSLTKMNKKIAKFRTCYIGVAPKKKASFFKKRNHVVH